MDASEKRLNGSDIAKNGICQDEYPPVKQLVSTDEAFRLRSNALRYLLKKKFNREPSFYVRVPGRVNIIGEHIDYSGYGVLPSAIQHDMVLCVAADGWDTGSSSPSIHLTNVDGRYLDFNCSLDKIDIQKPPSWHDYFLCGIHGILHDLKDEVGEKSKTLGSLYVAVDGTVPPCSGLSSSSSLVSAAALATSHAMKLRLSKLTLASISARTERNVGTEGGGMDQAIQFLASKGCAKLIEFKPLRCHDVRLPKDAALVVAHSLATINKAAGSEYNTRVVECRIAAQIIAKLQNLTWQKIRTLGELEGALSQNTSKCESLRQALSLVESVLHEEPYRREEVLKLLEISESEFLKISLNANTTHLQSFKLKQRASHVYQEAIRVHEFEKECMKHSEEPAGGDCNNQEILKKLGELMNSSHASLKDLYECSHPQLDQLVDICQKKCFGARLTGAGWGGCVVALTTEKDADNFVEFLKENFYEGLMHSTGDNKKIVFRTNLECGAVIYTCDVDAS
ncbi:N-acetylgalactosamine kinase-like [Ischnura elegans]|uniref:N-acetylgalactosamine kinase-like n=1 Tax=Ischnura elegans TaxID=197161 RepID=UPI001ED87C88|nr:N-acetylgalactosamine kinase-like [Ischnura elegans]XP_046390454.1 N-acetylgalactosamine kinase-like [Ischnura elegans]XP_046390455.1 N-acetylgalactosamine kinase-like [Ischnura elegans]